MTDFIVLLAGWSTTKNSDAALFEVCLHHVLRGEQETVSIGKNLSSVCVGTSQPEDQREQMHEANWSTILNASEGWHPGLWTPWTSPAASSPDSQGLGLKHASHSIQLDLLCLSWSFLAAIINPLINPHLLCLHAYSFVSLYGGTWLSHLPVLLANCAFTSKRDSYFFLWQLKSICFHFKTSLCN